MNVDVCKHGLPYGNELPPCCRRSVGRSTGPLTDQTSLVELENRLRAMRLEIGVVRLDRQGNFDVALKRKRDGRMFVTARRNLARALDELMTAADNTP